MYEETLEFAKMPSHQHCSICDTERLRRVNLNRVDLNKVKEICNKYGFDYSLVYSTFGGDDIEFVLYYKTDLNESEFNTKREEMKAKRDWALYREWNDNLIGKRLAMHRCVNELDLATDLYFEVSWSGNSGLFGSHNIGYMTYRDTHLESWEELKKHYSLIYDFRMPRGVFLTIKTYYLKPDLSKCMFDFTIEDAFKVAKELYPSKANQLEIVTGKRACDTNSDPYQAILVGKGLNQVGSLTIGKSDAGVVHLGIRAILGGETSTRLNPARYREQIKDALAYIGINKL
jgi:hypothetical protein